MRMIVPEPNLTERVRDAILGGIVDGTFKTGDRLGQIEIASQLGVSRQPVSHALKVLQDQGVLVQLGRKGLTVAPMDADHLVSLYQVRGAMDALAARLAAEQISQGQIQSSVFAPLRDLIELHLNPTTKRTFADRVDADVTFHVSLYRLSGNLLIEEVNRPHWIHFRRSIQTVLEDRGMYPPVWEQHRDILEAILAGDGGMAASLALEHTQISAEKTASRLRAGMAKAEEDSI
jgi:DNA-binding GntR family transcriptional regulator